ncbi:D-amino acid aminotransferase [Ravibacter arvi]|uniref:branched-chain-amino-acid transaminase n=1 Tax=Ravibacter arvi TaxID=2051041 RepID=A0ABP8MC69_9BACT
MPFFCYFREQFYPLDTPILQSNDLGLLRGYGLFDYFRTYNGIPFRFEDYWARFTNSAASLGLEVPLSEVGVRSILQRLYDLSEEREVAYRLLLTGGYAPDGLSVSQPNFIIRTEALPVDNPEGRKKGIKVIPYEYVRDLPYVKSTGYVHLIKMRTELKQESAADLLFYKNGLVSELTRSNIFIVRSGILITPSKDALRGITRKVVMEKAVGRYPVEERDITLAEVLAADEVFTTSTTKWVMPVTMVGDTKIGSGLPGPVTAELLAALENEFVAYGRSEIGSRKSAG